MSSARPTASRFELDVTMQKPNVTPKADTVKFPCIEELIAATLPFSNSEDLLKRLTSFWCEAFYLRSCVFLWRNNFTRSCEVASLQSGERLQRDSFLCGPDVEGLPQVLIEHDDCFTDHQWQVLVVDGIPVGQIGFSANSERVIPEAWFDVTARLLASGMTWEWNLREAKLASLAEYAAGAGHEINNPLAAINGRASQLLKDETDPQRIEWLQTIGAQTYRIRDMIGDSMLFAHPPALQLSSFNLTELIETVVSQLVDRFHSQNVSLWGRREPEVMVTADIDQIAVVLSELIRNSLNAVGESGKIEIDCYLDRKSSMTITGPAATLRVGNDGPSLTDEERQHCFDPFYSARQAGRGLGFGLTKCWRIVREHSGTISLSGNEKWPTEFVIHLPVNQN